MSNEATATLLIVTLLTSIFALYRATRMNAYQHHEFDFFLREHHEKLGTKPGRWAKLLAWNAALGGPAPKWHWIAPVTSPKDTSKAEGKHEVRNSQ